MGERPVGTVNKVSGVGIKGIEVVACQQEVAGWRNGDPGLGCAKGAEIANAIGGELELIEGIVGVGEQPVVYSVAVENGGHRFVGGQVRPYETVGGDGHIFLDDGTKAIVSIHVHHAVGEANVSMRCRARTFQTVAGKDIVFAANSTTAMDIGKGHDDGSRIAAEAAPGIYHQAIVHHLVLAVPDASD